MLRLVVLLALAGCDSVFGLHRDDAAVDMTPLPVDQRPCYGAGLVRVCLFAPPTMPLVVATTQVIDTGSSLCPPYDDPAQPFCVLSGTDIVISDRLRGSGPRPLVLVASGTITITGELDVSSKRGIAKGTGTEPTCAPTVPLSGGGGPGGSLHGHGGNGGPGAGVGSTAAGPAPVIAFTPGCAGMTGARTAGGTGGAGGDGGGAVALIGSAIEIQGTINASGAGGGGGASTGTTVVGGGGGGAGGTIVIDGAAIALGVTARVFANGGGGGEGAAAAIGVGSPGADPAAASANARAAGGAGIYVVEGDGGGGAGGASLDGAAGGDGTSAGGGGGGGAGRIVIVGVPTIHPSAIVSPPP